MKFVSTCFLLSVLLAPCSTEAQTYNEKTLKDLGKVGIAVEDLSKDAQDMGLSAEALESQTLVDLKRDIPGLKIENVAATIVYVNIRAVKDRGAAAVCVDIALRRFVNVLDDSAQPIPIIPTQAAVWSTGTLLLGPPDTMASRVRDVLAEFITKFAAAYYRQNGH